MHCLPLLTTSSQVAWLPARMRKRKCIGQFLDDSTLSYLNARYYEGSRCQFLSEDPVCVALGTRNAEQARMKSRGANLKCDRREREFDGLLNAPALSRTSNALTVTRIRMEATGNR